MNAKSRATLERCRELDLLRMRQDIELALDEVLDQKGSGYQFEEKALEEALTALLMATTALGRASRLADASVEPGKEGVNGRT